jgi:hypothetical protein
MKKGILTMVVLLLSVAVKAQTFVCTDIKYRGSDLTPQQVQKEKAKYLGSKATLTFYDNSLKMSVDEGGKTESIVLDKINGSEYQTTEKRGNNFRKMVLKLNKWVEYIRSFTIEVYKNNSLEGSVTYKRD